MNKRSIYYFFGPITRRVLRRIYYFPSDTFMKITGKRNKLEPAKGKVFIGSGDFIKQGKQILEQLIANGSLKPSHRVLDIGCGIGRLAVPLTTYFNNDGSYEGFDVVKSGITWCKNNIENKYTNFKFTHVDLKNELYNLKTTEKASDFIFPYNNSEFDFIFLTSVFTHMLPDDMVGYLDQINRVLKKGGTCFATFFIINKESKLLMFNNDGIQFKYDFENYYLHNLDVKEANVAYEENFLFTNIINKGFKINECHYGYWSGRKKDTTVDFQDIIIFEKK